MLQRPRIPSSFCRKRVRTSPTMSRPLPRNYIHTFRPRFPAINWQPCSNRGSNGWSAWRAVVDGVNPRLPRCSRRNGRHDMPRNCAPESRYRPRVYPRINLFIYGTAFFVPRLVKSTPSAGWNVVLKLNLSLILRSCSMIRNSTRDVWNARRRRACFENVYNLYRRVEGKEINVNKWRAIPKASRSFSRSRRRIEVGRSF